MRLITTTKRLAITLTGSAVMLVLAGAVPAPAAAAEPDASVAVSAGTSWAETMRLKLGREAHLSRLGARLPELRATVTERTTALTAARTAEAAATVAVTRTTTTVRSTHATHAAARTSVAAAKKALVAARKHRPYSSSRVAKADKALRTAQARLQTRAAVAGQATTALKKARAAHTAAARRLASATAGHRTAVRTVSNAQAAIQAWPQSRAALAARAATLSDDVVGQYRASFTTANTTRVYGVTVNRVVAYSFRRMIDDAAAAGIKLSGGGFRTRAEQIRLRTVNGCPDVWTAPASSCRVPTAIPGRSLHELGLAVDMTAGGTSINSRKNPAFVWMAANAGRYGFVNLPSEPWHWSITGG